MKGPVNCPSVGIICGIWHDVRISPRTVEDEW